MRRGSIAMALLLLCASGINAQSTRLRRVALVIGNGDYTTGRALSGQQDSSDMDARLKELKFDKVILLQNAKTVKAMDTALGEFETALQGADQALFYYSGHGAQFENRNFLLPTGQGPIPQNEIGTLAFDVEKVFAALGRSRSPFNLVILDACRAAPPVLPIDPNLKCGGWPCGLAEPRNVPPGTIVAFATSPGGVAPDLGLDDVHSPYTEELLKIMGEPGLAIQDLFVRLHVILSTRQTPWENTNQKIPFMFRDPAELAVTIVTADDDLTVTVNGQAVQWTRDESRTRRVRLAPGMNYLSASLLNQKTREGGGMLARQQEWNYHLRLESAKDRVELMDGEACPQATPQQIADFLKFLVGMPLDLKRIVPIPWDCLPRSRWGAAFPVAAARIYVDPRSAEINFPVVEQKLWKDGFTLADNSRRDELDLTIAWAIIHHGVKLYDNGDPGAPRPVEILRQELIDVHQKAQDPAGDMAHRRAVAFLKEVSDVALETGLLVTRAAELRDRNGLDDDMRWAIANAPAIRVHFATRDFAAIRAAYAAVQAHNSNVANALALISNGELEALVRRTM